MDIRTLRDLAKRATAEQEGLQKTRGTVVQRIQDRLRELQDENPDPVAVARARRAKAWEEHRKPVESFLAETAQVPALASKDAEKDIRARLFNRPPQVPRKLWIIDEDAALYSAKGARILAEELRALRQELPMLLFHQRLATLDAQSVHGIFQEAAVAGDLDTMSACWHAAHAPGRPVDDDTAFVRTQMKVTRDTMKLPAEMAEEQELFQQIATARQEILASKDALLSGNEDKTVGEAVRQIKELEEAGAPDAGAIVATERNARRRGEAPPARIEIPISRSNPTPPDAA